jgi:sugar phosphate isomerase/epimerase
VKVGILHNCLGTHKYQDAFRMAAEAGAEGVEIMYDDASPLSRPDHPDAMKAMAGEYNLAIPSLCLGFLCNERSLVGAPKAIASAQRLIEQAMRAAVVIGAKVVLVPFFGKNTLASEDDLATGANALLELVEQAEHHDVILGVESTLNVHQQLFLLDHLASTHVRIYGDTGNALARKLDVVTVIRDLGPGTIAQVHFKDVHVAEGSPPNYDVALGEGDVDFKGVMQALRAVGYDGWIVLETPGGADALANAKKNIAYVKGLL